VWFGREPLPEQHRRWIEGWLDAHPGWQHFVWTEEDRPVLVNERQFRSAHSYAQQSDVARYELLHLHGGVYLDTDVECLANIEPLLEGLEAGIASDDPNSLAHLGTSVMAAVPGHPWLGDLISAIPARVGVGRSTPGETGSAFVTNMTVGRPDVAIFPEAVFRRFGRPVTAATRALRHFGAEPLGIESATPPGSVVAVVDKGHERFEGGRLYVPFPERDGTWAGYPASDGEALAELERLQARGATFIFIPEAMFYWLNAYPALNRYLWQNARCVLDSESALVFELQPEGPPITAPTHEWSELPPLAGASSVKATVLRSLAELHALVPEWRELAASCDPSSIFQFPEWVVPWWEAFGAEADLVVLAVYDGARLAGVLPLMASPHDRRLGFIGGQLNARNGMLAAPDGLPAAWVAALETLSRLEDWRSLEFTAAPDADVRACLAAGRLPASLLELVPSPVVHLPSTWEAYLERLPSKRRPERFRRLRELAASHEVQSVCLTGDAITEQQLLDFHARRVEQWQESGRFEGLFELQRDPAFPRFLVESGKALARLDHLVLTHLLVDGQPIASELCLRWGRTILDYLNTYERRFARFSPGFLCILLTMKDFIAEGFELRDFGPSPEPYKFYFRAVRRELGGVRISPHGA
jgi:CelD/BcsL family acetyltransferase involved in cellulose biosynthesis